MVLRAASGPIVLVVASCVGCPRARKTPRCDEWPRLELACDECFDLYCEEEERAVGHNTEKTPEWCPFLDGALELAACRLIFDHVD